MKVIYDLLVKTSGPLELREDADQGVQVRGAEEGLRGGNRGGRGPLELREDADQGVQVRGEKRGGELTWKALEGADMA